MPHIAIGAADRFPMTATVTSDTTGGTAGAVFDVLEDFLHVDRPLRPSVQRRVHAANAEAIRTLRQLGAEDQALLAPGHARTICNAIAHRHGVKPRYMMSLRELGEQLTLEFASALVPSATRARLIRSAVELDPRQRTAGDRPRRRGSDNRPSATAEWMAVVQAVVALVCMATAALMTHGGEDSLGLAFAIVAVATLVFARAVLAISVDHRITQASPARRGTASADEIDLRATGR